MDWFYYVMGKIFFWGLLVIIIGGIGYYLGYNHSRIPILKDFAIVKKSDIRPTAAPKQVKIINSFDDEPTATPSSTKKTATSSAR